MGVVPCCCYILLHEAEEEAFDARVRVVVEEGVEEVVTALELVEGDDDEEGMVATLTEGIIITHQHQIDEGTAYYHHILITTPTVVIITITIPSSR